MVARSLISSLNEGAGTASAIPRLSLSASPKVETSADVHEFSFVEGDVYIGSKAVVAPGTAITAEQGASVFVGDRTKLLPGVIVEGTAGDQVRAAIATSANRDTYSVYISLGSVISHKSVVHSPAFVGTDCFVGFRSTIFNARLGDGCIVMMHALIQDVEIPPGRCVPSGSVITSQHQADQLPKVRPEDIEFAKEVVGSLGQSSSRSRTSSRQVPSYSSPSSSQNSSQNSSRDSRLTHRQSHQFSTATEGAAMPAQRLSSEIVQQVRDYLAQGYRVGMEHADKRRYRSGVWETCTPIKETREQAVFSALENCLAEHTGEYVRMFGINPTLKQRVGMITVQRPGDAPIAKTAGGGGYGGSYSNASYSNTSYSNGSGNSGGLPAGVAQEVRNLLNGGYMIGTEHAGPRHYRSNVWKVCSPIESRNEREVFSKLEHCLDEHSGEYVRMFGIDSGSNSRTATTTIQRADGKPVDINVRSVPNASHQTQSSGYAQQSQNYAQSNSRSGGSTGSEVAQAVSRIIHSGNHVGVEFADKRRYRSGIWQTAPSISASSESAAINQLQRFLDQNGDKYVRIFGINIQTKTRGAATTVHKPGQRNDAQSGSQSGSGSVSKDGREAARGPINANPPHYDDPAYLNQGNGGGMDTATMDQVTQLINQGHKISIEFADKRRYRSGIWKTGPAVNARRPAEAISALGKQLAQHPNEYVRLIATDSNAKRRVAELTIQRPGQKTQNGGQSSRSSSRGVSSTGRDPIRSNPPRYDDPAFRGQRSGYDQGNSQRNGYSNGYSGNDSSSMEPGVMDQVTQLVNQGHRISVEYADKRRYRSGIWKTGEAIDARRPAEAISALGKQLARHQGEYVRLIGTDPQAKRRVLETTIQRP